MKASIRAVAINLVMLVFVTLALGAQDQSKRPPAPEETGRLELNARRLLSVCSYENENHQVRLLALWEIPMSPFRFTNALHATGPSDSSGIFDVGRMFLLVDSSSDLSSGNIVWMGYGYRNIFPSSHRIMFETTGAVAWDKGTGTAVVVMASWASGDVFLQAYVADPRKPLGDFPSVKFDPERLKKHWPRSLDWTAPWPIPVPAETTLVTSLVAKGLSGVGSIVAISEQGRVLIRLTDSDVDRPAIDLMPPMYLSVSLKEKNWNEVTLTEKKASPL